MATSRTWVRAVIVVGGLASILLVAQYLTGLWTNVYAPTQFASFHSMASYPPALKAHIASGDALFVLSLLALVFAALARRMRLIVPAAVLVASVFVAGELGMMFVNSTPNDAVYSFGMGAMFLVALFSAVSLPMLSRRAMAEAGPRSAGPAPDSRPA